MREAGAGTAGHGDPATPAASAVDALRQEGIRLYWDRRPAEAIAVFERLLAQAPQDADAAVRLAESAFLLGDLPRAFAAHEARIVRNNRPGTRLEWIAKFRLWDGSPGKRLVIYAEQGHGDIFQFARYIPAAQARCAALTLWAYPANEAFLARHFPVWRGDSTIEADCWAPLMSLPHMLGMVTEADIPPAPYLTADPTRVAHWAARLPDTGRPRIGLAWAGNPENPRDVLRSMPVQGFEGLGGLPADFYALQMPPPAAVPSFATDLAPGIRDFDDTAAILTRLDLLVTVDTSLVHLAGALGRPVWVLVDYHGCWRWQLSRTDSIWYDTVRLFRQPRRGDWAAPMTAVRAVLEAGELAPRRA